MRLQLDEMQHIAAQHIAMTEATPKISESYAFSNKKLGQHSKKASLVIKLNKKVKARATSNSSFQHTKNIEPNTTIRRNSVTVNQTYTNQSQTRHSIVQQEAQLVSNYTSNMICINGQNYHVVSPQDIPENVEVVAAPYASITDLTNSVNTHQIQQKVEVEPQTTTKGEIKNWAKKFKSEHSAFVKFMRNFSTQ